VIINIRKIKSFVRRHRVSLGLISVAFMVAIGLIAYNYYLLGNIHFKAPKLVLKEKPKETRVTAPYTGLLVSADMAKRKPLAVVIENHPDARPQSGYPKADLVYETLAEGGITRTLAIFQSQEAGEIGPVRSARYYFIDWLTELGAVFVHVGGNIDALDDIAAKKIPDINQFYFGGYFWRSTDRYSPHNVYTTTAKLCAALNRAGIPTTAELVPLKFKKDLAAKDRPSAQNVTVEFSGPLFTATYAYDPKTNIYLRSISGLPHKDKVTGEQIHPKNIVVQYESMTPGITRLGQQKMNIATISRGKAIVFQDGKAISAFWEKTGRNDRTKLTNGLGQEIQFNPGQTWFEIVPQTAAVKY
jgi:hypothetical protein